MCSDSWKQNYRLVVIMTILVLMRMCVICSQFDITGINKWVLYAGLVKERGTGNKSHQQDKKQRLCSPNPLISGVPYLMSKFKKNLSTQENKWAQSESGINCTLSYNANMFKIFFA